MKGSAVADDQFETVAIRHPETLEEREVPKGALVFFENQGFEVLTKSKSTAGNKEK